MNKYCENEVLDILKKVKTEHSIISDSSKKGQEENNTADLLENVEKIKESEKIMSQKDFEEAGKKELSKFKQKNSA